MLATLNLEEIDAQVAKAQSVLDNAERNLERFENLRGKDALPMSSCKPRKHAWTWRARI